MSLSADTSAFQSLIDDAVAEGVAPGFQCVVFNRDSFIYNGVSGLANLPSASHPDGKPFKRDTLVWIASSAKLSLSLIVLHIIERGLAKSGFSMDDLDDHDALVEVLPEFKRCSGSLVTKIIEGFEDGDEDGRRIMKLREARGNVTLRMLLTHTAGTCYYINHPLMAELFAPSDGSVPHCGHIGNGNIRDFVLPLVSEPGTEWHYGPAADWLGQFAVRSSGKNLRELYKEIIFQPLGISPSEADIWISPSLSETQATMYVRDPAMPNQWNQTAFGLYATEGTPPEGKAYLASGCVISSLQAYAKVLQAVLNENPRILSKNAWQMAVRDDLKYQGLKIPRPAWKSTMSGFSFDVDEFAKTTSGDGAGANMLQCLVALAPTVSGRPAGSFGWAGLANTYFFIDPANGIGAIFGTQILPFFDPRVVEVRDKLEELVYKVLVHG